MQIDRLFSARQMSKSKLLLWSGWRHAGIINAACLLLIAYDKRLFGFAAVHVFPDTLRLYDFFSFLLFSFFERLY